MWNNATGNNAECPLFVWCLLNNVFGINSLMFHVCSTGRGWILMASNVIHCKLHCYHHLFACAPQTTLCQASTSQTHWLGDWQRFLQSADGSTLDPVSHGRTTLLGGLGERNLRYSVISCSPRWSPQICILSSQLLDVLGLAKHKMNPIMSKKKWLFSSFHPVSICIPYPGYPIHNSGNSRSNDSSSQSDVCGWCRAYGRIILSNHRKSQPVTRQTQARSTSL